MITAPGRGGGGGNIKHQVNGSKFQFSRRDVKRRRRDAWPAMSAAFGPEQKLREIPKE